MTASQPLRETELRKPNFRDGYWIRLGDGQEWAFPRPILRFFPARADDGSLALAADHTHDRLYQELRDELIAVDEDDHYNAMRVQVLIAGHLLSMNYDLDTAALRRLLPVIEDDPENDAMWGALIDVILANPPKPSPVGCEPSSGSTGSP